MNKYLLSEQDRATLQYKVTSKLREVILKGEFKEGERLIQEEWAAKLGVSRMPIRDALKQLEVEGLVRIEPRRGAIVTPISSEDINEIYELRALLEGEAVVQSMPNLTEEDLQELEHLYRKMTALKNSEKDMEEYTKLNKKFHEVLLSGCKWRRIQQMIDTLWKGIPQYTPSLIFDDLQEKHEEHRAMIDFIKRKDAEQLRKMMRKHILRTKDNLLKVMDKSKDGEKK